MRHDTRNRHGQVAQPKKPRHVRHGLVRRLSIGLHLRGPFPDFPRCKSSGPRSWPSLACDPPPSQRRGECEFGKLKPFKPNTPAAHWDDLGVQRQGLPPIVLAPFGNAQTCLCKQRRGLRPVLRHRSKPSKHNKARANLLFTHLLLKHPSCCFCSPLFPLKGRGLVDTKCEPLASSSHRARQIGHTSEAKAAGQSGK